MRKPPEKQNLGAGGAEVRKLVRLDGANYPENRQVGRHLQAARLLSRFRFSPQMAFAVIALAYPEAHT